MKKPLVGITFDHEPGGKGYSKFPWYALRENYSSSVVDSGGVPIPLSHDVDLIDTYIDLLDGLVITGGAFDVDPSLYGDSNTHDKVATKGGRTDFEWKICKKALEKNKPILGICGGQQLLNVVLGGTLIQHIPDEIQTDIPHEQPNPRNEAGHRVDVKAGTQLAQIVGSSELAVNSAHHQAVKDLGKGCVLNAVAPDGVIEGFEVPSQRFCLGLQWHPEFFISEGDKKIYRAFIEACRG
jgi:putative glutamine amidotransferase